MVLALRRAQGRAGDTGLPSQGQRWDVPCPPCISLQGRTWSRGGDCMVQEPLTGVSYQQR